MSSAAGSVSVDRADRQALASRARMLRAVASVCGEGGLERVTVAAIASRAGVSRQTFYTAFGSRDACVRALFDDASARLLEAMAGAFQVPGPWPARVRASVLELLLFLDGERDLARFLFVHALGADAELLARRRALLVGVAGELLRACPARAQNRAPALLAEGVVGGVSSLLHDRLLAGDDGRFVDLAPAITAVVLVSFLGPAATHREQAHTDAASSRPSSGAAGRAPDLRVRITHRTMRVLTAVADDPGASNKAVARAAGIADAGQASKLLHRLCARGLVENTGLGQAFGTTNAWHLTPAGVALRRELQGYAPA